MIEEGLEHFIHAQAETESSRVDFSGSPSEGDTDQDKVPNNEGARSISNFSSSYNIYPLEDVQMRPMDEIVNPITGQLNFTKDDIDAINQYKVWNEK